MKTISNSNLTKTLCVIIASLLSTQVAFAYPADPDNAALLYYQAFILYPKPDDAMHDMLPKVARGELKPDAKVTEYVESCRDAIEITIAAADIPKCNWGMKYSDGVRVNMPHLAQTRHMVHLILAEARTLADNGAFEGALDRCINLRKIAGHTGDQTPISLLVAWVIYKRANECVQDILGEMPEDLEILTWLKHQLALTENIHLSLKNSMKNEREVFASEMRVERIPELMSIILPENSNECPEGAERAEDLIAWADEGFVERNRNYYENSMAKAQAVLDLPYPQAYSRLIEVEQNMVNEANENPDATLAAALVPAFAKLLSLTTRDKTFDNALQAAVDIYIVKAKTGRLADTLPPFMPKDLFSGKDFEYEKSDSGFILRCQGRDLQEDKTHEYQFNVAK